MDKGGEVNAYPQTVNKNSGFLNPSLRKVQVYQLSLPRSTLKISIQLVLASFLLFILYLPFLLTILLILGKFFARPLPLILGDPAIWAVNVHGPGMTGENKSSKISDKTNLRPISAVYCLPLGLFGILG